ncbi:MAG: alpha/beta hydrolase, partial [Clostridia bacterium]|nr:alpha/beta hydrolase [Clostridia bacterium]
MYRFAIVRKKNMRDYWKEEIRLDDTFTPEEKANIRSGERFIKSHIGETCEIESFDGLKLRGRIIENENPVGLVIMVHGYRSHPVFDFSCAVEEFYRYGFSMLLISHRAHGLSEGTRIGFGVHESRDLVKWAEFMGEKYPGLPVIFDGVSMGGATVMMSAGENLPGCVKAMIADCGYTSPGAICRKVLYQWFKMKPFPIYYGAKVWVKLLAKYDLDGKSSQDALRKMAENKNHPCILIAHGEADDFVPYSMALECRSALPEDDERVWFVSSETAGHGLAFLKDRQKYIDALKEMYKAAGIEIREG